MAVRIAKIDAASTVPVVELTVVEAPRCAAIDELSLPNAAEDGIELGIADVEGVVVALELLVVIEEECKRVVDTSGAKWSPFGSAWRPKMRAKNCAAALLSRVGTMVWLRVIVIGTLGLRRMFGTPRTDHRWVLQVVVGRSLLSAPRTEPYVRLSGIRLVWGFLCQGSITPFLSSFCHSILLFEPRREHSSVPTAYFHRRRAAAR
jgi:hypothetical protein